MNPIPKTRAIKLLQEKIDQIPALQAIGHSGEAFTRWHHSTETLVEHLFGVRSKQLTRFAGIHFWAQFAIVVPEDEDDDSSNGIFLEGLSTARATLLSMIDDIQTIWPDDASPAPATPTPPPPDSRQVFLVHGRDNAAKETVARFLEHLGLKPIILSEQPNGGKTLIEKFEREANNASYAVVLFTPDDIGGLQSADDQQARARQNVIFELGYFAGRLGRDRVCILTDPSVEIPSDIFGLGYVPFDSSGDGWKIGLGRELKNAGFNIDGNKVLS
jgi:predicted nucleotide-binding protein